MKTTSSRTFGTVATTLGALALMTAGSLACAGTLSGATSTQNGVNAVTNPPKITAVNKIVQIKHLFGVAYYGPDKNPNFTCTAKLEYTDGGEPPEMVAIKYPMDAVGRMRQYTKPGKYTASLTGVAHNGHVACLGDASSTMTIEDGMQGLVIKPRPAHISQVVLRGGNEFTPGTVQLYSTISLSKTAEICHLEYSVLTANAGSNAFNVELMKVYVAPVFTTPSHDFNPGSLNFPNTGKFRVVVKASAAQADNQCTGSAQTDFEIKRKAIHIGTSN